MHVLAIATENCRLTILKLVHISIDDHIAMIVHVTSICMVYDVLGHIYIYNWDSFYENGPSFIIIKSYKIALHLNRNNFRTIKAINFLFSTLHTTPFLYGKIHFGVLHLLRARIATSDTPPGSNST